AQALGQAGGDGGGPAAVVGGVEAGGHAGVEQAGPVEVHGHAGGHHRGVALERPGPAAAGQVGVLDADHARRRPAVVDRRHQVGDVGGVERAVGVVEHVEL